MIHKINLQYIYEEVLTLFGFKNLFLLYRVCNCGKVQTLIYSGV